MRIFYSGTAYNGREGRDLQGSGQIRSGFDVQTGLRMAVRGGHCAPITVAPGDSLTVVNREGGQEAVLFRLGAGLGMEGPDGTALGYMLDHAENTEAARAAIGRWMQVAGADGHAVVACSLFDGACPAGSSVTLEASADELWILSAPGRRMLPHDQDPSTDLDLLIRSKDPASLLPPVLSTPLQEIRVAAGTARAYAVKAGDYIQIVDVQGSQCSDFLAFDAEALAGGREYGLDPTATRTLTSTAMPGPGLHSKFFDERLRPLVEVVQDTVGRHDMFLMACSARYYEDAGYPGHDNCTDNFNRALEPHGVGARSAWAAINFFYNVRVEPCGAIGMDEPWSRPGDFVLLRALTDLVCASSSCADDIDPANGWIPTDIHVRTYDKANMFAKAVAHRTTHDASPVLTRDSGFAPRTATLSRHLVEYRGFWLPDSFSDSGPIEEYWGCREKAAVMDLSALRKFEVVGPDAEALMQWAVTRDMRKLSVGQVVYTAMCYDHGGMIDDGTVFRLGQNNFRWVCGDDYCGVWLRALAERHGLRVSVRSSTDQLHNIAVQGPESRRILSGILSTPPHQPSLDGLKWFRFTIGRIGGPPGTPAQGAAVVVSRTGYTGELGFEIWCHPRDAVHVWDAVSEAGTPLGLKPLGLQALDMLRIEAGLAFAGTEFCDQTDPFEAGIGFTVPADKPDDYVGREALARRRAQPRCKLVGLDLEGSETVSHGDPVYRGRAQVGSVTSATRSPLLRRTIALARLDLSASEPGSSLEVGRLDGHLKRISAVVTGYPAFDPQKTRVRA